jgi:hypothetical protein
MKLEVNIPDTLVAAVIEGIMENFPEASSGSALVCVGWKYDDWAYKFRDTEDNDRVYKLDRAKLLATFPLIFTDKWPRGLLQPPCSADAEIWDDWLCQSDACSFDAFAQLACFGEVIYG